MPVGLLLTGPKAGRARRPDAMHFSLFSAGQVFLGCGEGAVVSVPFQSIVRLRLYIDDGAKGRSETTRRRALFSPRQVFPGCGEEVVSVPSQSIVRLRLYIDDGAKGRSETTRRPDDQTPRTFLPETGVPGVWGGSRECAIPVRRLSLYIDETASLY